MEKILSFIGSIPKDKLTHALVGLIIYSFSVLFINCYIAFVLTAVVGAGKEVYDLFNKDRHTPDVFDFLATISIPFVLIIIEYLKG